MTTTTSVGHFVSPEDRQTQVEKLSKTEKMSASYSSGLHWECLVSDVLRPILQHTQYFASCPFVWKSVAKEGRGYLSCDRHCAKFPSSPLTPYSYWHRHLPGIFTLSVFPRFELILLTYNLPIYSQNAGKFSTLYIQVSIQLQLFRHRYVIYSA